MSLSLSEAERMLPAYLSGDLSDTDEATLRSWREESPENESYFQEILKAWEATALLTEMEQFNPFEALNNVNRKIGLSERVKWVTVIQRVAAVLLLPLLIYSGFITVRNISLQKLTKEHIVMQTVSSRQGMVTQFMLADKSKVWLNSGSELQFPSSFTGDFREVRLKGEAFFEVTRNENQPFRVNAKELNIEVLGTSFNVINYDDDNQTEVILAEGKVKLSSGKETDKTEFGTMHPGQRAVYVEKLRKIYSEDVQVDKYIGWRSGNLIFRDDPMEDVVKRLSRWFNVEIVINDPEIRNYIYKATFRNENLKQVLELLRISAPIDYKITEPKALMDGEFIKQRIYLMKRKS